MSIWAQPRIETAMVSDGGDHCPDCKHGHWMVVAGGIRSDLEVFLTANDLPLVVDMNGALCLCRSMRKVIVDALGRGLTVRIIRQGATHLDYNYNWEV